ncbi:3132_t:CDS:1 [Entrophospora sp. SA101]|nr:3132_t:CDS:1 [Entrophospora sp. SA101]
MAKAQQLIQQQQPLIQRSNFIHFLNNNNQNTMSSTNTPVVSRNHNALYVRPVLNTQLNSRSIITPTLPNLPMHTQRQVNQRTVVQQPRQQSTNNNNINNVSIPQQTQPSTIFQPSINQLSYSSTSLVTPYSSIAQANNTSIIDNNSGSGSKNKNNNQSNDGTLQTTKPEKFTVDCNDVFRKLDAKARERIITSRELTNLSDDEKAKICEKLELLKPMLYRADEILTYYTKSHIDTLKFLEMKYMIDDQLKALPGKYLLSLKQADDLLTKFGKYFEFVENTKKELNFTATNSLMPADDLIIPPIANKIISLAVPNKKYKLENDQENKSSNSHENINKKRRLEIHVTDRNEIKNNNSENVNNYNNSIDSLKDYDKEPSFEELYETIRKLDNTMKDNMDTGEATRGGEENHFFRTHAANISNIDYIGSALSKAA